MSIDVPWTGEDEPRENQTSERVDPLGLLVERASELSGHQRETILEVLEQLSKPPKQGDAATILANLSEDFREHLTDEDFRDEWEDLKKAIELIDAVRDVALFQDLGELRGYAPDGKSALARIIEGVWKNMYRNQEKPLELKKFAEQLEDIIANYQAEQGAMLGYQNVIPREVMPVTKTVQKWFPEILAGEQAAGDWSEA